MGFLAPVIAAVGAILSSSVGSLLVSVGLQAASRLLAKKPKNREAVSRGRQLNLTIETDAPNLAVLGKTAVGGSLVYRDTYGPSNKNLFMIICLADHECDGIETIYVDGQPVGWDQQTGAVSNYSGYLYIEFFNGAPGQAASQTMINYGKGKWTADHIGTGRAYVVVRLVYSDKVWPNGVPSFRFVVRGLKLYDWRLDSTNGGSGSHRIDQPNTWQWTENPVVALVNYMMGIEVQGVKRWGRNVPLEAIDLDSVTIAANACDEDVPLASGGSEKRYCIGGVLNATVDHKTHEDQILECFMGLMVNTGGYTRIQAGVAQVALMHFDDGDIVIGTEMVWQPKQSGDQLVNTIRGKFTDPDLVYEPGVTLTRFSSADVLNDGGELAIEQDFESVTSGTQCQRLMEILRREARLQGQLDVVFGAKAYLLQVGDWVTISSDRQGWANKVFEVMNTQVLTDQIGVRITFKETAANVFDWSTNDELGAGDTGQLPVYTPSTFAISGLSVSNFILETPGGERRPGLSVTWGDIDDTRVISVVIEYRPIGEINSLTTESHEPESGTHQFVNGVLGNIIYEVRVRPVTSLNSNEFDWTPWVRPNNDESTSEIIIARSVVAETVTNPITFDDLSIDVQERLFREATLIDATADINRTILEQSERTAESAINNMLDFVDEAENSDETERRLLVNLNNTKAQINEQLTVLASEDQALANALLDLQSTVNDDVAAQIQQVNQTVASNNQATATQINDLSTTVNGHTSSISAHSESIDGFSSAHTIQVSNDGNITGFAQLSGTGEESAFNILADRFRIAMPGENEPMPAFVAQLDGNGNPELLVNGKVSADNIEVGELNGFILNSATIVSPHITGPNNIFEIDARDPSTVKFQIGA